MHFELLKQLRNGVIGMPSLFMIPFSRFLVTRRFSQVHERVRRLQIRKKELDTVVVDSRPFHGNLSYYDLSSCRSAQRPR